jgi:hypothetical protein
MVIKLRSFSPCSGSIALLISVSTCPADRPLFALLNVCDLGFITEMEKQIIPWGALIKDPYSWMSEECVPPGFEWKDPSKIQIGEIFRLLDHWRDRQDQFLDPLIWMPSCPLLLDAQKPSKRTHNVGQGIGRQYQVSTEETFDLPLSEECEEGDDESPENESSLESNDASSQEDESEESDEQSQSVHISDPFRRSGMNHIYIKVLYPAQLAYLVSPEHDERTPTPEAYDLNTHESVISRWFPFPS